MKGAPADPSPAGEGGREADGWGGRRTTLPIRFPRALRKRLTPHEVKLWNWLRETIVPTGFHIRRQVPIDDVIVDFACLSARLVIELDGEQHGSEEGRAADRSRDARLAERGYRVLRFTNREIDREKRVVLDTIYAILSERSRPHPSPSAPPSLQGRDQAARPTGRTKAYDRRPHPSGLCPATLPCGEGEPAPDWMSL